MISHLLLARWFNTLDKINNIVLLRCSSLWRIQQTRLWPRISPNLFVLRFTRHRPNMQLTPIILRKLSRKYAQPWLCIFTFGNHWDAWELFNWLRPFFHEALLRFGRLDLSDRCEVSLVYFGCIFVGVESDDLLEIVEISMAVLTL